MSMSTSMRCQRGMTLIVALILLVVATTISMASFQLGMSDFRIAGNMQHRAETAGVAQQAIENAISSTRFFEEPTAVYPAPCSGQNTFCADVTGDGNNDVLVTLDPAPECRVARVLMNSELDLAQADDLGCTVGVQQTFGLEGSGSGSSLCANTVWQIRAVAVDNVAETRLAMTEGVAVRVAATQMATHCSVAAGEEEGGGEGDGGDTGGGDGADQ